MMTQVAKWGNSQGIRLDKRTLKNLGSCPGDMLEIIKVGGEIILKPIHGIDWCLQDYERPEGGWESIEPEGREIW